MTADEFSSQGMKPEAVLKGRGAGQIGLNKLQTDRPGVLVPLGHPTPLLMPSNVLLCTPLRRIRAIRQLPGEIFERGA